MNNTQLPSKARLRWGCRRGMLELDLLLLPYLDEAYDHLSTAQQHAFVDLLIESDSDLYVWLMGQASPLDPALRTIVQAIRSFHQEREQSHQ